jgi:hypothetical protein
MDDDRVMEAALHGWTHSICDNCWPGYAETHESPDVPYRMIGEALVEENCCWCGQPHRSGIYVRYDPVKLHGG